MAWWNSGSKLVTAQQQIAEQRSLPTAHLSSLSIPSWGDIASLSVDAAMSVPAFLRGVRLITGTCAQLPLVMWRGREAVAADTPLLRQPEAAHPYWVTIQRTVQDMVLFGHAFWLVTDIDPNGYPTKVLQLPANEIATDPNDPEHVTHMGEKVRVSHPAGPGTQLGSVIIFDGYQKGALYRGADILQQAAAIEAAVKRYAEAPLPSSVLRNTGADLPEDQIEALLSQWELSRNKRSTAYLNSALELESMGWAAVDIELSAARNETAIAISRLLNLDPHWLGASVSGTSLTYSNRVDLRGDLIDLTLSDYMNPIEQRLTMRDCTPTITSNRVQFDTTEFLRNSLQERVDMVAQLLPLNVITPDEARQFLNFAPGERSPLQ